MIALVAAALLAARPLPRPGVVAGGRLAPGETHVYEAALKPGEFLAIAVTQRGVDVLVTTTGPGGVVLSVHDGPYQRYGLESVALLPAAAGVHRVEVFAQEKDAIPGAYDLEVREWRAARPDDSMRLEAQKAYEDGCIEDKKSSAASRASAVAHYREARDLWRKLGDGFHEASTLILLGDVHRDLSDHRLAIEEYEAALAIVRARRDRGAEAKVLRKIGTLVRVVGDPGRALGMLEEAARISREVGDPQTETSTLRSLGWAWLTVGDYQKALEASLRGLEIARSLHDLQHESGALDGTTKIYEAMGDLEKAIEYGTQSVDLAKRLDVGVLSTLAERSLGLIYLRAGRPEKARAAFVQSLETATSIGDRRRRVGALTSLGDTDLELGDLASAFSEFREGRDVAESVDYPLGAADAWNGLGRVQARRGEPEPSLYSFGKALDGYRKVRDREGEQRTLTEIGRLQADRGRLPEARAAVDAALTIVESQGARFRNPEVRLQYGASSQRLYALGVEVLLKLNARDASQGLDRRAFELSERGRARALLESLAAAPAGNGATRPLDLAAVQALVPDGDALVSFAFTEDSLAVFLVGRTSFEALRLPLAARPAAERVGTLVDLLARGDPGAAEVGRALSRELVAPWRGRLGPEIARLFVLPDGPLHELPFDALPAGASAQPLIEELRVSYAPSAAVLARLAARRAPGPARPADALIVADPARSRGTSPADRVYEDEGFRDTPIPFSRREGERVAGRTGSSSLLLLGEAARKERLAEEDLSRFRILHFATHAFASRRSPALSALALAASPADSGFLSAAEIYRFRLDGDLVVLSGCQTARGRILPGEGVQGLVSAFLHAGARSVVASLWNVNDEATAGLMDSFYRALARGLGKADALREARLELLHRGAPPRLWAPFVLVGDADATIPLERTR